MRRFFSSNFALGAIGALGLAALAPAASARILGRVTAEGEPVPGTKVLCVTEPGTTTMQTMTDGQGIFLFESLGPNSGQCMLWAELEGEPITDLKLEHDTKPAVVELSETPTLEPKLPSSIKPDMPDPMPPTSPAIIPTSAVEQVVLELMPPAVVEGRALDEQSRPLAGVEIIAAPAVASGFRRATRTDAEGRFHFRLPPYDQGFWLICRDREYYAPSGQTDTEMTKVTGSASGPNPPVELRLRRWTEVRGVVRDAFGRPVASARLSAPQCENPVERLEASAVSDDQGSFTLKTGKAGERLDIKVSHELWGQTMAYVELASDGTPPAEVKIALSGTARVRGHVLDPDGRPIAEAAVGAGHPYRQVTGPSGEFDLGNVPLPPSGKPLILSIHPQRPKTSLGISLPLFAYETFLRQRPPVREQVPAQWFQARRLECRAAHGETLDVNIRLEPAPTLEVRGRVRDSQGGPVPDAAVLLFMGTPSQEHVTRAMSPMFGSGGMVRLDEIPFVSGTAQTDAEGRFTLSAIRESTDSLTTMYHIPRDTGAFTLGVLTKPTAQETSATLAQPSYRLMLQFGGGSDLRLRRLETFAAPPEMRAHEMDVKLPAF